MSKHHSQSALASRPLEFPPEGSSRIRNGTIGLGSIVAVLALLNLLAGAG